MQIKSVMLNLTALMLLSPAFAQDRLYKKNGKVEEVKIKEIGPRTVTYKKWSNQEGPDFVIPKADVEHVVFENGEEESFGPGKNLRAARGKRSAEKYGMNIISFSPIHVTNTSPTGFDVAYERVLDKNYLFSFYIPVVYSFRTDNDYYNNTTAEPITAQARVFWINPGFKFYPAGGDHKVSYAVGPTVAIATGQEPQYDVVNVNGNVTSVYREKDIFMMAIQVTNYLNIQPTPQLHIGLALGLGIPYVTEPNSNNNNYKYYNKNNNIPIADLSFRVGYRF